METGKREEVVLCECGCGQSFLKYDDHNRPRRFVSGHNAKGQLKERVVVSCDYCHKVYERLQSHLTYDYHFCSKRCKYDWMSVNSYQSIEHRHLLREIALRNGNKPPLMTGEDHWNWKGGISEYNRGQDTEFCKWRKAVFSRDNYTCQICGVRGGRLSGHHIKGWAKYPELRYDLNNGQCLCYDCHMELHGLKKKSNG